MQQMSIDFDTLQKKSESSDPKIYAVSEINEAIKKNLEAKYPIIWLKGEISNFKPHTSGHFYFSLKDQKAQINAVMFKGFNQRLKFKPESGMEVIVRGKITVYEPRGTYQIFCETMDPVGAGAMQMAFEQLKKKLAAEGLFDPIKKRAIPDLPRHVALVTSPTGAAVRDMIHVLNRRFKALEITVVPCVVQGDAAPASIVDALTLAQRMSDIEVVIVGRGGGSIEDLWAFNNEAVARAIANCRVPIISAVGHEIDFTIADFVADLRAPTPSAAAELVVKNAGDLVERIQKLNTAIYQSMRHLLELKSQLVLRLGRGLVDPQRNLQDLMLRCDELAVRLSQSMRGSLRESSMVIEIKRQKLKDPQVLMRELQQHLVHVHKQMRVKMQTYLNEQGERAKSLAALLDSLSPLGILARGYSIVKKDGAVINKTKQLRANDNIDIVLSDGQVQAKIL